MVEFVAPRTETERVITGIVRRALGTERVGVTDDFFALGGDSVMAAQIIGRVSSMFDVPLELADVADALTVERLAQLVDRALEDFDAD